MIIMSSQIYTFDKTTFPIDDIALANPQGLQGGAFFSKLKLLGNNITMQTPKCKTKNGIVKTEKKIYCDLMFENDDDNVTKKKINGSILIWTWIPLIIIGRIF
jgi:hypothetical protein